MPIYLDGVPEFTVRGDCIRIVWRELDLFVPVPHCREAVAACNRALDQWHDGRAKVIPIKKRKPRH